MVVTASLNERYNALLLERAGPQGAGVDLDALTEQVHRTPMLESSYFGRFLAQPIFIEGEERAALERDLTDLLRLLRSLPARLFSDDVGRMCDAVGMGPLQRRAVLETWEDQEVFLSRADLYQSESGFKLLEFNILSALGGFENAELNKAMLAAPLLEKFVADERLSFPDTIDMIAAEIHRAARRRGLPSRPRLVIVEWPTNFKGVDVVRMGHWAAALSARGFDATICHAGQLRKDGDGLSFDGRPVDVLYRYFLIEDLLDMETGPALIEPVLEAHRRGRLLLAMGFAGELLGNKRNLALLSDDANRPYFTGKELALIDRMVPWTRTLAPGRVRWRGEERDLLELALARQPDFVLKPSLLHGALGFVPGWAVTPEQWRAELERAARQPYVLQERVHPRPLELARRGPHVVSLEPTVLNWGVFVIDDRLGGAIIRGVSQESAQGIAMGTGASATGAFWHA